jgi:hypothetical protein
LQKQGFRASFSLTMKLNHGLHLAYCTNVHRGETWAETFRSLQNCTLAVRDKVCPQKPFAIGLRLGERAAVELAERDELLQFQRWLGNNNCYVFTMNGFPYGNFHGARVKEKAYRPDWTSPERVAYTNLLFDLLAQLVPAGVEGSVSTLPGSFKGFHLSADALKTIRNNLWRTVEHIAHVSKQTGRKLHLGLEPEPLCQLESSAETIHFFEHLRAEHPRDERLAAHLGVNYDACHFAVEFEEPQNALPCLVNHGIKISKIQLGSALKVVPTLETEEALKNIPDDGQLHQVCARDDAGNRSIYRDLPEAIVANQQSVTHNPQWEEWRVHFHVPFHAPPAPPFENTNDHLLGVLDLLQASPEICPHIEMETCAWEVLPPELKSQSVVDQLAAEYGWTLAELATRGLC